MHICLHNKLDTYCFVVNFNFVYSIFLIHYSHFSCHREDFEVHDHHR